MESSDFNENIQIKSMEYAMMLMKSYRSRQLKAINIFKQLLNNQDNSNCRLSKQQLSDILYNLALVLYAVGNYEESRKYCQDLVSMLPDDNRQVRINR